MERIMKFFEYNGNYAGEWPLNKQNVGVNADDVSNNQDYAKKENKFQEVQEQMKIVLKPIILKKNKNADDRDIEKVMESFFRLGNSKNQEIRRMVDGCKDTKQCAQEIVNKYLKYVKINFNAKDDVNNVEQDSVMSNESIIRFKNFLNENIEDDDYQNKDFITDTDNKYHDHHWLGWPIGTKVKALGVNGIMEYGVIVPTPKHVKSDFDTIVRWDTDNEYDYEEWIGATFLKQAEPKHVFKYINDDGTLKQ